VRIVALRVTQTVRLGIEQRVSMPDELSAEVPVEYSSGLGAVISRVVVIGTAVFGRAAAN
jgi:hypothetical protein